MASQDHPEQVGQQNLIRHQLIVFRLGQEEYGLHIDQIKEVVLTPHITRMPKTPFYIKGVANIRGNIIAIVDLEEKFGIKEESNRDVNEERNYTLVVESDTIKMGVLVAEVPNTLSISSADIDESPNLMQDTQEGADYVRGIVKSGKRLIILIDILEVMAEKEVNQVLQKEKSVA
ncbi:chemotaxis protein CheW [Catalinimonas niigatensis]|uniref:chemotaxis protein CheW n=1 Tax=Catalinimonas niigatensis TaxID=1397264 RepID=UPI0026668AEC|nr:chemotaxis protein CheW [Catalinimonas niigatensis]WPP53121.1 chemotaxis protein CheW [Catalinimonas niigatensis]